MWLDNASEVDILFYEPYANVIADISKNPSYKPLILIKKNRISNPLCKSNCSSRFDAISLVVIGFCVLL